MNESFARNIFLIQSQYDRDINMSHLILNNFSEFFYKILFGENYTLILMIVS